ncbi:MAG: HI0074 family nucleotidyltransferase substrate-binding subunit [Bacteroidota bacterium]
MSERLRQRLDDLGRVLGRLDEALAIPLDNPLAVDGTLQRFEFTFELAWKALKDALATEGIEARTPKAVLRAAFGVGWLEDEAAWLDMLDDRNLSSHVYREDLAAEIYERVSANAPRLREAHDVMVALIEDLPDGRT